MKFGISFTATFMNQGAAMVVIYRDGSVQVNHGGTEMGQGVHTKIAQIAADGLGVRIDRIRVMPTRTDKIPNTSATAASASTDLNGAAVLDACMQLKARLAPVEAEMSGAPFEKVVAAAWRDAFRCLRRATTGLRGLNTTPPRSPESRSIISSGARRFPRWKSICLPAIAAFCAWIFSKTRARRFRR